MNDEQSYTLPVRTLLFLVALLAAMLVGLMRLVDVAREGHARSSLETIREVADAAIGELQSGRTFDRATTRIAQPAKLRHGRLRHEIAHPDRVNRHRPSSLSEGQLATNVGRHHVNAN